MITASASEGRFVSYVRRRTCEILAQQVTLQLVAMTSSHLLQRQLHYQLVRSELIRQVVVVDDIPSGLCGGEVTLLDLIDADGAVARIGGMITSIGSVPIDVQILELIGWYATANKVGHIFSAALESDYPELANLIP